MADSDSPSTITFVLNDPPYENAPVWHW